MCMGCTHWENKLTSLEDKENPWSQLYDVVAKAPYHHSYFQLKKCFPRYPSSADLYLHFVLTTSST